MSVWPWVTIAAAVLGAAGSVASLIGLRIAMRAERRARSAEAQVRAVVERNRRVLLAQRLLRATAAAKLCLNERTSQRAWEAYLAALRTELAPLTALKSIAGEERRFTLQAVTDLGRCRFREDDASRILTRITVRLESWHGALIETLTDAVT